jgi:hypothetical protein
VQEKERDSRGRQEHSHGAATAHATAQRHARAGVAGLRAEGA